VKKRFFASATTPGSGAAAYSPFHDVDGSGSILANDFSEVKKRFFNTLPAVQAPSINVASGVFGATRVRDRTLRDLLT
jgi:hypothetical protein